MFTAISHSPHSHSRPSPTLPTHIHDHLPLTIMSFNYRMSQLSLLPLPIMPPMIDTGEPLWLWNVAGTHAGQPWRHRYGWDELVIILNTRQRNLVTTSQGHKPIVLSKISTWYSKVRRPCSVNVLSGTSLEIPAIVRSSLTHHYQPAPQLYGVRDVWAVWLCMGDSFQQLLSYGSNTSNNSWNDYIIKCT